jgi:hypothetical protein
MEQLRELAKQQLADAHKTATAHGIEVACRLATVAPRSLTSRLALSQHRPGTADSRKSWSAYVSLFYVVTPVQASARSVAMTPARAARSTSAGDVSKPC